MYSRVIMPLDGSNLAEHILPYVRILANGLQVPVDIVRVVEPAEFLATDPDSYPKWDAEFEAMLANVKTRAGEYINDVAKELSGTVPEVNQVFDTRDPVEHIINQANLYPDALIAMSTHGRAGIRKWVMGSVTEKVMSSVENPMLIVRPREPGASVRGMRVENVVVPLDGSELAEQSLPVAVSLAKTLGPGIRKWVMGSVTEKVMSSVENPMLIVRPREPGASVRGMRVENVVVPLDGSELAEQSLPVAVSLAKTLGLGIVLVRVISRGIESFSFDTYHSVVYEDIMKSIEQDAVSYLSSVGEKLEAEGVTDVEQVVCTGYAPTAIMETSQEKGNAIIAMTSHGRTGMKDWLMGSVADKVVRGSGIPVLLTRPVDVDKDSD
jgi:nucleotide-binding universal stress UspA family protein